MARSPCSFELRSRTILLGVAGSRAQGLAGPDSDVDLRGVAIPPGSTLLGIHRPFEQADRPEDMASFTDVLNAEESRVTARCKLEGSVYALAKFARLCVECNPHMLELLFCRDSEVRLCTSEGDRLRKAAPWFLSQKVAHTFTGYALSQLKRIQGHRRWLLEPPSGPPTRADYGLPERTLLPRDQMMAAQAVVRRKLETWSPDWGRLPVSEVQRLEDHLAGFMSEVLQAGESEWHLAARAVGLDDNLIAVMDRERRFRAAQRNWTQFRTWQRQRSTARAELEARFGYDTKHGAHLMRLLRMGREIMESGEVHVWRADRDADELRAIRQGVWSYDELVERAQGLAQCLRVLRAQQRSPLPIKPDIEAINGLVVELTRGRL